MLSLSSALFFLFLFSELSMQHLAGPKVTAAAPPPTLCALLMRVVSPKGMVTLEQPQLCPLLSLYAAILY